MGYDKSLSPVNLRLRGGFEKIHQLYLFTLHILRVEVNVHLRYPEPFSLNPQR